MSYREIVEMLKTKCKTSKHSQEEIATKAGITRITLNRFINGKCEIRGDNFESLLNVFGMTLKAGKLHKKK